MRGSISMQEAYDLTWEDNKDIQEFLKDNMDRFKGSMTPAVYSKYSKLHSFLIIGTYSSSNHSRSSSRKIFL